MEGIKKLLHEQLHKKPNKRLHSEIHALADEISSYFGERQRFAMYLGTIKRVGVSRARIIFSEVRDSDARDPRKLFFWKCRKPAKPGETLPDEPGPKLDT
jgi:hypothetical protein